VPPAPGVFSAVGLLFSQTEHELVRTLLVRAHELEPEAVSTAYAALEDEARASLADEGIAPETATLARLADLRYAGQAYELTVRVPDGAVDTLRLTADFVAEHVRTYGHGSPTDPVDLVSIRVLARVNREALTTRFDTVREQAPAAAEVTRQAYFGPAAGLMDVPVFGRAALAAREVDGPAFVDEYDSTTVVPPGSTARLDAFGSIEIDVG